MKIVGQELLPLNFRLVKMSQLLHMQFYRNCFPLGFANWLTARANILHRFLSLSRAKPQPILHEFSPEKYQSHMFTLNSDWLTAFSTLAVIGG